MSDGVNTGESSAHVLTGYGMKAAVLFALLMPVAAIGFYLLMDDLQVAGSGIELHVVTEDQVIAPLPVAADKPLAKVEDLIGRLEARLEAEPNDASGWYLLGQSYEFIGRHDDARKSFERAMELGYLPGEKSGYTQERIKGSVSIDPSLMNSISMTDTVFVYARAVNGPRLPLAVMRKQAADIPFDFELNDSMAISPTAKLSDYPEIILGARVSASGDATAKAGDLEGFSSVVSHGTEDVIPVVISQSVIR